MSNSDYLIKATIKKLSEKLNKSLYSKIDEAAAAAQEVPELLKKEIEILKDDIIEEAKRMEQERDNEPVKKENTSEDSILKKTKNKINIINQNLNEINSILEK